MPATSPPAATAPESATTALYRAALGPVNTAHYLALFARFDEAGRASPVWNWAAGGLTLNWLVFRQVWLAALVYVACAEGLALLVLGLGRRFLHWPPAVEWGVLGALLALCIAIPGAYGTAWLHAETRRRMTRAVREARTVREACAALEQQASTQRRLWGLVVLNVLLAVALVGGYIAWSAEPARPPLATVTEPPAQAPFESPPPEPVVQAVPPEPQVPPPILAPARPEPAAPSVQRFAINVGLFADPANAEKAHARLIEAGLPAFTQTVEMPKGLRTRVRVGPFTDHSQVEAAAERIRALGLEAQVYQP